VGIEGPRYEVTEELLGGIQPPDVALMQQTLGSPDALTRRTRAISRGAREAGCRSRRS
jgi:hypothetical protein